VILDNAKINDISITDSLIGNNSNIRKGRKKSKLIIGENSQIEI
jgi:glucose-1-phosphate thymidylyltransferase